MSSGSRRWRSTRPPTARASTSSIADEAVCIGPPPSAESYLNIRSLIAAAEITGADAIHPGYGFLSENAHFAEVLRDCRIHFIGPPPEVDPPDGRQGAGARDRWPRPACRCCPEAANRWSTPKRRHRSPRDVGYPVILKAAAGGGGRGMSIVEQPDQLAGQLATASEEAATGLRRRFGLPREVPRRRRATSSSRSSATSTARSIHLGERECSIQRRHQKLIEESPSPALTPELRERMGEAAVRLCREVGYDERRHHRVPARRGRPLLLHGDEHPHPGRAPGHRDGLGRRPRQAADPGGGWRAAAAFPAGSRRAATRSSAGSTPRIPTPSLPPRAG